MLAPVPMLAQTCHGTPDTVLSSSPGNSLDPPAALAAGVPVPHWSVLACTDWRLLSATGPPQRSPHSASPGHLGLPPVSTPKSQVTGQEVHGVLPDGEPRRLRTEAWRRCFCHLGSLSAYVRASMLAVPSALAFVSVHGKQMLCFFPFLDSMGILSSEVPGGGGHLVKAARS